MFDHQEGNSKQPRAIPQTFKGLSMMVKTYQHVKIPQRMFNPLLVKNDCRKDYYKPLEKNFYQWKDMMFRNGFLYHRFNISKLTHENVCPNLSEVKRF